MVWVKVQLLFSIFKFFQSSVATQLRWGGRPCNSYIVSFLRNPTVTEFWTSVYICRSYNERSSVLFFKTHCIFKVSSKSVQGFWSPRWSKYAVISCHEAISRQKCLMLAYRSLQTLFLTGNQVWTVKNVRKMEQDVAVVAISDLETAKLHENTRRRCY